jgi:ABC-type oligopeptide transport system ATPase subunit
MLVQLQNIHKIFPNPHGRDKVRAVDGVSLDIREGENLGLVGESGSGKTTLGRIILKLYTVDGGTIRFGEEDITGFSARQMRTLRPQMQMVFQDPFNSLDPRYTIRSILAESLLSGPKLSAGEQQRKMQEMLAAVRLPADSLGRFVHEFSGGERQRIAIARALLLRPRLLILDEAVSSLDVLVQMQILELLEDLQKQYPVTYLFISHNLRVVRRLCQRIAVMYRGRIVEIASTAELFANPLHGYTRALLTSALEYRSGGIGETVDFDANSELIDKGRGHFVLS